MTLAALIASAAISPLGTFAAAGRAALIFISIIATVYVVVWIAQLIAAPWRHAIERGRLLQAARRKAKPVGWWDESALGVSYNEGRFSDKEAKRRKRPPTLKFWLYALKPIPQPNRLRLWFTVEPKWWMVN